jgi:hypothetical protein
LPKAIRFTNQSVTIPGTMLRNGYHHTILSPAITVKAQKSVEAIAFLFQSTRLAGKVLRMTRSANAIISQPHVGD